MRGAWSWTSCVVLCFFFINVSAIPLFTIPSSPAPLVVPACDTNCAGPLWTLTTGSYKFFGTSVATYLAANAGYIEFRDASARSFYADAYFSNGIDTSIPGAPPGSGVFYNQYSGTSPIDNLLQIQSVGYIMTTWNKIGYSPNILSRTNSFQQVIATDNVNTYACYIYPDNITPNGGLDWSTEAEFNPLVGVSTNFGPMYRIPDSGTNRVSGIDGVAGDKPAATFTGTHGPGVFCFFVSDASIVPLGPAMITSPTSSQVFLASTISSVPLVAQGLLNSRAYSITANAQTVVASISSTSAGAISSSGLNLSGFPDGTITIALIRTSDGTTAASVNIIKGTVATGAITSPAANTAVQTSVTISGTGEDGAVVRLTISDTDASGTTNVVTDPLTITGGVWSFANVNIGSQVDGAITIVATFTDGAGNTGSTPGRTIIKDTVAPTSRISSPTNLQFIISAARANKVAISGYGEPGAGVFVTVSDSDALTQNVVSATVSVSSAGTWGVIVDVSNLQDGVLNFIATATDIAGNVETPSSSVQLNKDTVVRGFAVTTPSSGSSIIQSQASSLLVSGTGEAGGRVALRISGSSGQVNKTVPVGQTGTWSTTVNVSNLPNGAITIAGTATDQGNRGSIPSVPISKL